MKKALIAIMTLASVIVSAQPSWTMQQCMQYAVEHNHEVRRAALALDNSQAAHAAAVGRFLPAVDAGVGMQYNFGRAIDPETNGYTHVSTLYNGYSLSASLPVFDGFGRVHALRAARAGVLMGRAVLRQQQDAVALSVMQAYVSAAYYAGMVAMAEEKAAEAALLLRQTHLLEEVGRKSAADVAQMESQKAEADYELTRQQNLLASALLELNKEMGAPDLSMELRVESMTQTAAPPDSASMAAHAPLPTELLSSLHSALRTSFFQAQAAKHEWRQARAALYPTLSLSTGLSTTYYKTLHTYAAAPFHSQLHNNMGEYVGATLSIPLFSRLQPLTSIRRAKNNYLMACEAYEQKRLELELLSREAWQDRQACRLQTEQMVKKVEADSMAYQLTRRQYEEGLSTAIDLHTTSAAWLSARATLLQCRLMTVVKEQLIRYYRGETLWTESLSASEISK